MAGPTSRKAYTYFVLAVSGLGGLLYGIDIGIIDPALAYLNRAIALSERELSAVVAAVLAGSILGSVVAGMLADWLGRKRMLVVSALMFVASVAIISLSQSFQPLILGRLLQGMSGGVIAVVVPLYLAECLPPSMRGRGMALFQFMLTLGIVLASFVGSHYVGNAEQAIALAGSDQGAVRAAADHAWRGMFLTVAYPGALFLIGSCFVVESPRWLVRRRRHAQAVRSLQRLRGEHGWEAELADIDSALAIEDARPKLAPLAALQEIFTERRYVLPFILACVILGCNQATGINSLLQFMSTILQKAGLDPVAAASYGSAIKIVNSAMTIVAIMLVERKGRVFLLKTGTAGIIASLCLLAALFYRVESQRVDVRADVAALVQDGRLDLDLAQAGFARASDGQARQLSILYNAGGKQHVAEAFMPTPQADAVLAQAGAIEAGLPDAARALLAQASRAREAAQAHGPAQAPAAALAREPTQTPAAALAREPAQTPVAASGTAADASQRAGADKAVAASYEALQAQARQFVATLPPASRAALDAAERVRAARFIHIGAPAASLEIVRAKVGPIPGRENGLLTALCIAAFIAFFSIGPGVCVWLALSELMPTRIRSVGMGVALLVNQGVATLIAGTFLPIVGNYGFYAMFAFWAGCTVIYFVTAAFFLPETKGKTLEEIEGFFAAKPARGAVLPQARAD